MIRKQKGKIKEKHTYSQRLINKVKSIFRLVKNKKTEISINPFEMDVKAQNFGEPFAILVGRKLDDKKTQPLKKANFTSPSNFHKDHFSQSPFRVLLSTFPTTCISYRHDSARFPLFVFVQFCVRSLACKMLPCALYSIPSLRKCAYKFCWKSSFTLSLFPAKTSNNNSILHNFNSEITFDG